MQKLLRAIGRLEFALAVAIVLLGGQLAWPAFSDWLNRPRPGRQVEQRDAVYPYLIYLPDAQHGETLMLYLHGSGARGTDLDPQRLGGPASFIASGRSLSMIVVTPQCPADFSWEPQRLRELLEHLQKRFEPERIVVTGYSMGGGGAWDLVQTYPELIDAAAPVCGCGNPSQVEKLRNIPVWAFHGKLDEVIPLKCSREMVEAINAAGGMAKLTTFSDQGHDISQQVYENPGLYEWLLDPQSSTGSN